MTAVANNASKLVDQAKGDFPTQTSAITTSVNTLKSSVAGLSSSPSAAQIATITKDAGSVVKLGRQLHDREQFEVQLTVCRRHRRRRHSA